jgi:predicted nucleic acid-binding protein
VDIETKVIDASAVAAVLFGEDAGGLVMQRIRGCDLIAPPLMDVDHAAVLALAERTGLTGYDASYLHLARTLEVELVTLDHQLAEAAENYL